VLLEYLEILPGSPAAQANLGLARFHMGKTVEAYFTFQDAISFSGAEQNALIRLNVGENLLELWRNWPKYKKEMQKQFKVYQQKWKGTKKPESIQQRITKRESFWDEAIIELTTAVRLMQHQILSQSGSPPSSSSSSPSQSRKVPDRRPWLALAEGYAERGRWAEAAEWALRALAETTEGGAEKGGAGESPGHPPSYSDGFVALLLCNFVGPPPLLYPLPPAPSPSPPLATP
jgi:tetratricopeptide (TPR) repeat protein